MKILWANANLLHPTTKGGQIRSLEMLQSLRRRHEIHYVSYADPAQPEAASRSGEYCFRLHVVERRPVAKNSIAFLGELAGGLFTAVPVAVSRHHSSRMQRLLENLLKNERFDRAVCDHLAPASHFGDLGVCLLFQHNVETAIWRRHEQQAEDPLRRYYFRLQADRMQDYEGRVCREAGQVVAVSPVDAEMMRQLFGISRVSEIATGVNLEYFAPPATAAGVADLVFIGSMDWMPNIHGVRFFVEQVLPLIRRKRPGCSLAIVGRAPAAAIVELSRRDPKILVTGTVADVRPYLWGSLVSVVPLYIGGGTRLKIYESMAARTPVVSTSIGAEGLCIRGETIRLAETPEEFARQCLDLLEDSGARQRMAAAAWEMVAAQFTWEQVTRQFEQILERGPGMN